MLWHYVYTAIFLQYSVHRNLDRTFLSLRSKIISPIWKTKNRTRTWVTHILPSLDDPLAAPLDPSHHLNLTAPAHTNEWFAAANVAESKNNVEDEFQWSTVKKENESFIVEYSYFYKNVIGRH